MIEFNLLIFYFLLSFALIFVFSKIKYINMLFILGFGVDIFLKLNKIDSYSSFEMIFFLTLYFLTSIFYINVNNNQKEKKINLFSIALGFSLLRSLLFFDAFIWKFLALEGLIGVLFFYDLKNIKNDPTSLSKRLNLILAGYVLISSFFIIGFQSGINLTSNFSFFVQKAIDKNEFYSMIVIFIFILYLFFRTLFLSNLARKKNLISQNEYICLFLSYFLIPMAFFDILKDLNLSVQGEAGIENNVLLVFFLVSFFYLVEKINYYSSMKFVVLISSVVLMFSGLNSASNVLVLFFIMFFYNWCYLFSLQVKEEQEKNGFQKFFDGYLNECSQITPFTATFTSFILFFGFYANNGAGLICSLFFCFLMVKGKKDAAPLEFEGDILIKPTDKVVYFIAMLILFFLGLMPFFISKKVLL